MKKYAVIFTTFVFFFSTMNICFGESPFKKYANAFLEIGVGGRSLGMGGASVALATDVTAGYWNPAGLSHIDYPQFMLMHSRQFEGVVNYDFGGAAMPMGKKSSLGFSIIRLGIDGINKTALPNPNLDIDEEYVNENGETISNRPYVEEVFGNTDYAFMMTYSKRTSTTFSYGGNIKFINRSVGDNSAWGIGFDLGFWFNPTSKLMVGINLQDITSTVLAWDTGTTELITPSVRAGLAYPLQLSALGGQINPAIDFIFRFENRQETTLAHLAGGSMEANVGWEYQYRNAFSLRVGLAQFGDNEIGQTALGQFTTGFGLNLPKLKIDYAFLGHNDLGNTHRISAQLTLEEPKFLRKN